MNYNAVIYNILQNDPQVTALVGTKVYPITAEQTATFPYVVFRKKITPINSKGLATCIDDVEVEINVVDESPDDADNISREIRDSLDNTKPGIVEGITVSSIQFVEQGYEMYDDEQDIYIVPSRYQLRIIK